MQEFIAILDRPIGVKKLMDAWELNKEQTSPPVEFQYEGESITVILPESTKWDTRNFREAFQMAVHRVDRICKVQWEK